MERIRQEAKRLIKRKQIAINTTTPNLIDNTESPTLLINSEETSINNEPLLVATTTTSKNSKKSSNQLAMAHNDLPIFSMNQVNAICERMLAERETALREQYDKILTQKTSEQYDAFVKFTHEQIQRRFEGSSCSYVS